MGKRKKRRRCISDEKKQKKTKLCYNMIPVASEVEISEVEIRMGIV